MNATYYLMLGVGPWREVTEQEYVAAERSAGFHPKSGRPQDKPSTSSFSNAYVQGKVRFNLRGSLKPSFKTVGADGNT
jgi:hypothetical protein